MLGRNSKGTWESLLFTHKLSKAEAYNPKGKGWKVERQSEELIVVRSIGTT